MRFGVGLRDEARDLERHIQPGDLLGNGGSHQYLRPSARSGSPNRLVVQAHCWLPVLADMAVGHRVTHEVHIVASLVVLPA